MISTYTVAQVGRAEAVALRRTGSPTLMARASTAVAVELLDRLAARGTVSGRRVVLLVGGGNNGGDALLAGARLRRRGVAVTAVLLAPDRAFPAGLAALRRAGGRVVLAGDPAVPAVLAGADAVVDGIVGIGATPPLRSAAAALVELAARATAAGGAVRVAVDVPSGLDPDTGAVPGADPDADVVGVLAADVTVTFGGIKPGLLLADAVAGTVVGVDVGFSGADGAEGEEVQRSELVAFTDAEVARLLPGPGSRDDKYSGGLVGIAAGSPGYPGAPVLCVGGAVRTRPGMVRYAGAQGPAVLARWPEVVPSDTFPEAGRVQAWVVGPGIGTGEDAVTLLRQVLQAETPAVVDADALTVLAAHRDLLQERRRLGRSTVLTPHEREFARVFPEVALDDRLAAVRQAAAESGATVLLKGHRTLVAQAGAPTVVNLTGSPWLATAGSGDVLSGVLGSLLAAGLPAWQAAGAAAHLHGRAGERAAAAGSAGAHALWDFLR